MISLLSRGLQSGSLLDGDIVGEKQISTVSIEGVTFPLTPYYHENYRNQDATKKAIDAYNEAIRLKPDLAIAYSNRGPYQIHAWFA